MNDTDLTALRSPQRGPALWCKRVVDLTAAAVIGLLGLPFLLCVAALLAAAQGLPVLFRQARTGWLGRPFTMLKFRTMREAYDAHGRPLPDEERVTWIGRLVRQLSLDEFPQLLNVLRGEMSLIGNRPLPIRYLGRMTPKQQRRYLVLPGMTGLDTISGRYGNTWEEQFALELLYVDHWSPWLDVTIAFRTFWVLLTNRDQTPDGLDGRGEFLGPEATHEEDQRP